MAWELRYPPDERARAQRDDDWRRKRGKKLITRAAEPEPIHEDLTDLWLAWWQLGTSRQQGMSVGSVPLSEMRAMLDEIGVRHAPMRARWIRLWQAMELTFIRHAAEKGKTDGESRAVPRRQRHAARRGPGEDGA